MRKSNKKHFLLLQILALSIVMMFLVSSNATAVTFELGVRDGTTYIYEIKKLDDKVAKSIGFDLEELFGSAKEGYMRCYEIYDISSSSDSMTIDYYVWDWTSDESAFQGTPEGKDEITSYIDPADVGVGVSYLHPDLMSIIPTPVDDYLLNVDWDLFTNSSGETATSTLGLIEIHYEYDKSDGFLTEYRIEYNSEEFIVVEYTGEREAGLDASLIILIVVFAVIALVAVIVIVKKTSKSGKAAKKEKKIGKISKAELKKDLMGTGISKKMMKSRSKWETQYELTHGRAEIEEAAMAVNKCPSCGWFLGKKVDRCIKCGYER